MYVTTINIPIVFDADSDQEARERLELLLEHFAQDVTLGTLRDELGAEISDAPTADRLQESLRYQPLRTVSLGDSEPVDCDCSCHTDPMWTTDPVCPRCFDTHVVKD